MLIKTFDDEKAEAEADDDNEDKDEEEKMTQPLLKVRTEFPETWLWFEENIGLDDFFFPPLISYLYYLVGIPKIAWPDNTKRIIKDN